MPANRFFFDGPLEQGRSIDLQDSEHHHVSRVMRIAAGEEIEIVNGRGILAFAKVAHVRKESTELHLIRCLQFQPSQSHLTVAIPLMRPNKLEWVLEKAVELGANALSLYAADHSEKDQYSTKQLERLRNLSISALKQSGRLYLPSMTLRDSLESALRSEGTLLYGDTASDAQSLLAVKLERSVLFASGPEQGFSPAERELLREKAQGVRLSPHILRAETAPLAALSILSLMQLIHC